MLTRKLKKIPGITVATALKAREFKMVAEAVEKCKKNWKNALKKSCFTFYAPVIRIYLLKHFMIK